VSGRTKQSALPVDLNAWVWQMQALEDLAAFLRAHGPGTSRPLPVLNWRVAQVREVSAEVSSYDPRAFDTLQACADVLGVLVDGRIEAQRTLYKVRGRIGRRGVGGEPRTRMLVQATIWHDPDSDTDERPRREPEPSPSAQDDAPCAWGGVRLRATASEKDAAMRLRAEGLSYGQIGARLGRSKTWAHSHASGPVPVMGGGTSC
jgi:hypothetical protein